MAMISLDKSHLKLIYSILKLGFLYNTLCFPSCYCWSSMDTTEVFRPRGVPLSKSVFYEPTKDFSCIDGTGLIPFHFVNDDYCDCGDGSDEPGTAACSNGRFHCANTGYISMDIPSTRVNDNICDCCDGSDEFSSNIECSNQCSELGKQAKEEAKRQEELFNKGYSLWQEYSIQGKQIKEENKIKLKNMQLEQETAEKVTTEKEALKLDAESKEKSALSKYESLKEEQKRAAEEYEMQKHQQEEQSKAENAFKELDINQDGLLTYDEIQQFPKFDSNQDGVVSEEEGKFFLHMKDSMELEEFITTGWMIMKPLYLTDKVEVPISSETFSKSDTQDYSEDMHANREIEEINEDSYNQEDDLVENSMDEEDDDDLVEPQPGFPHKDSTDEPPPSVEPQYDEETQRLVDEATAARQEYKEAFDKLENIKNEMKQIQADLDADFGPEDQFAVLKGQCFDFDDREYTYRLCPFDRASQIPKSGGSETNLGKWGSWIGPDGDKYSKMKYENGQGCWNGPARTAMVLLNCGLENKIFSTSEPNRCEYLFEFSTPALCYLPEEHHNVHEHTEL